MVPLDRGSAMTGPTVSVVVPVRDGERYLAEALESLLAQTPAVHEVIVVDDGSTDHSAILAERVGNPVRCLRQPGRGPGAARNTGIAASRGEFVGFLDADDRWATDALSSRLAAFAADPSLDLVFGHVRQFLDPRADGQRATRLAVRPDADPGYLPGGLLARRAALERVGAWREDVMLGDFVDWMARAREAGLREELISDLVLWRRLHGENLTRRRLDAWSGYPQVVKAALDRRRAATGEK
jgi:glycosyltransferase involved in cell wall biosynthesis